MINNLPLPSGTYNYSGLIIRVCNDEKDRPAGETPVIVWSAQHASDIAWGASNAPKGVKLYTVEARNASRERDAALYFLHTFIIMLATIILYGFVATGH